MLWSMEKSFYLLLDRSTNLEFNQSFDDVVSWKSMKVQTLQGWKKADIEDEKNYTY